MYRVNDIFYSLQGEGRNTGRAAVFIRFAGCNLRCPFCDTAFDSYREMSGEEILEEISRYEVRGARYEVRGARCEDDESAPVPRQGILVVLTGGEPTLQVDEAFVDLLHQHGYEVAMESNGTRPAPKNLDWLTVSPKDPSPYPSPKERGESPLLTSPRGGISEGRLPDEIKIVFEEDTDPEAILAALTLHYSSYIAALSPLSSLLSPLIPPLGEVRWGLYLQPCDTGDPVRNAEITKACVEYIKSHPQWRLSLQTHKLIGIE